MSVGIDVKQAYIEVGTAASLIDPSGTTEYIDYEANSQVTKPFIQEFFLEAYLPYDTAQIVGGIVRLDAMGNDYMIMGKTPILFENAPYEIQSVYYKCNVSGELFRPSGEIRDPDTYEYQEIFGLVTGERYALMTEPLFGTGIEIEDELGVMGIERNELYIPSSYGIRELDRYQPFSGEYYKVERVLERRFSGVDVCELTEDNR